MLGAERVAGRETFLDAFVDQGFLTVLGVLKMRGELVRFARFEKGEGIEKRKDDFADEVMSQIKG